MGHERNDRGVLAETGRRADEMCRRSTQFSSAASGLLTPRLSSKHAPAGHGSGIAGAVLVKDLDDASVGGGGVYEVSQPVEGLVMSLPVVNRSLELVVGNEKGASVGARGWSDSNGVGHVEPEHNSHSGVDLHRLSQSERNDGNGLQRASRAVDGQARATRSADGHFGVGGQLIACSSAAIDPTSIHVIARHVEASVEGGSGAPDQAGFEQAQRVASQGTSEREEPRAPRMRRGLPTALITPMTAVIVGLAVAATLALSATPAAAAFPPEFGGPQGEEAGQFSEPESLAVDNSSGSNAGDVYVADRNNNRIDKFGPNGEFLLAWGWGVADGESARLETCRPQGQSAECFKGLGGEGAGEFAGEAGAVGVAVDGSSSASAGDVYVEDAGNHRVEKFKPSGEFVLAFGKEGAGEGEFVALSSNTVAVDGSGTVYVGDVGRVQEFSEAGVVERQMTVGNPTEFVRAVAVDAAKRIYVTLQEQEGVHVYEPCPSPSSCTGTEVVGGSPIGTPGDSIDAIALGPLGELLVSEPSHASGARVGEFVGVTQVASVPSLGGFASALAFAGTGAAGRLLLLSPTAVHAESLPSPGPLIESQEATAEPGGTATVKASIDPEGASTSWHLDYGPEGGPLTETTTEPVVVEGFEPEAVQLKLEGLKPATKYVFHFVAGNINGAEEAAPQSFTSLPALSIESEWTSQVSSRSARLAAQINPLGTATDYRFEYLSASEFAANGGSYSGPNRPVSVPAPEGELGSATVGLPVSELVEGLTPSTTYHYRAVAHNECEPGRRCEIAGSDRTFTTQSSPSAPALIDGRSYELVSPPDKHGAPLEMPDKEAGVIQAAPAGGGLTYFAAAPPDTEPAGSRSFNFQQLLSMRTAPGTWSTEDIATRQNSIQGIKPGGTFTEYKLFSDDLRRGLVEPVGAAPLSTQATEHTPYVRNDQTGEYQPLLPAAGLLPGVKFGGKERNEGNRGGGGGFEEGVQFVGGNADLSHDVVASTLALTGDFKAGFENGPTSLYEWNAGTPGRPGSLTPVSILPGEHQPAAEAGVASALGTHNINVRNAISADGSRVVFEAQHGASAERQLLLRDVGLGQTLQLDLALAGVVVKPGFARATFVDATADDSRVFFLDTQRLTKNSSRTGSDLYMCQVTVVAGNLSCALKDLSVAAQAGEGAGVEGVDLGIDKTGTYIYFVASGVLAPGAKAGEPNLYWENTASGEIQLVATLGEDSPDWEPGAQEGGKFEGVTARVSGNGRFVAFMSDRSLTGYDNVDSRLGASDEEVFLYDRLAGTLACASCDPSGARPVGVSDPGAENIGTLLADNPGVWQGRWLSGSLPVWPFIGNYDASAYQPRNLSNSGGLFFDSANGLVPQDVNGLEDVYEFEPEGVGPAGARCEPSGAGGREVYKTVRSFEADGRKGEEGAGCVGLISSGASSQESVFMDASGSGPGGEEGQDVFFMSSAGLVSQDTDGARDVYDAHQCSPAAPCASHAIDVPPACTSTESCRSSPAPQPPVYGAPASTSLSVSGNLAARPPAKPRTAGEVRAGKLAAALRACHKRRGRKRRACEKAAHKKYGLIAQRARHDRRATR